MVLTKWRLHSFGMVIERWKSEISIKKIINLNPNKMKKASEIYGKGQCGKGKAGWPTKNGTHNPSGKGRDNNPPSKNK